MMSRGSAGTGGTVRSSREIRTASARGAVVGAAIGFGLGLLSGEGIAHSRSDNPGLVVALIGFPIVGGYAGSRGLGDKSPAVIYRTP